MTGRTIGHYRMIDKLGEGGMGKVYRAVDVMVDREVALKSLKAELAARPEVVERFRSEATTLARLNHPNVAQLYSFFKDGNEYFMVMEYVPGKTLEQAIQQGGSMPWRQALEIASQVLDGIQHAHQLGILHRDIKPANIILPDMRKTTGGFTPVAKVTDFGIAQALGSARVTREGHLIGTLEYIAPERIQGKGAGAQSDLYSMAVVLYEMLSGRLPFQAESEYSLLLAQVQQPPPRLRKWLVDVPPAVENAVMRGLEKDPAKRYPDAANFAAALRAHLAPDAQQAGEAEGLMARLNSIAQELGSAFRELSAGVAASSNPSPASRAHGDARAMQIVLYSCLAVIAAVLLGSVVFVGVARFSRPVADTEVATVEEAETPAAPRSEPSPPVPEFSYEPGVPIPIGQILRGGSVESETELPEEEAGEPDSEAGTPRPGSEDPAVPPRSPRVFLPAEPQPAKQQGSDRATVMAALDLTDGPTIGKPGEWPIHRAGLAQALRMSRGVWLSDIAQEVERRGVNFLLTPSIEAELKRAGADKRVLLASANGLRSLQEPPPGGADPAVRAKPPQTPAQVPAAGDIREVRHLYLEAMPGNMHTLLRTQLQRELKGILVITQSASSANARMSAREEETQGGVIASAGRVLGLRDKYRLHVRIVSAGTAKELWYFETGDRSSITATHGSRAMQRAVSKVASQLRRAYQ